MLKENMRNSFFELITDIANYSYVHLLEEMLSRFQDAIEIPYVAIYSYNNWKQTYERITSNNNELEKQPFKDGNIATYLNKSEDKPDRTVSNERNVKSHRIHLHTTFESKVFLVLAYESGVDHLPEEMIQMIKQETERYLNIFNYYNMSKVKEKRNAFLFELTTKFYAVITKKNILTEITNGMDTLYPLFTYYILLSQDYEEESPLPIKTIEYSDKATKRVSTQAFITGEVQLENRVQEKKTFLYVPLKGKQGVYGVLQIIMPNLVDLPKSEIAFIAQFGSVAGRAIESATLFQNSNHLVKDLKLINDATHALNSNLNITEITAIVREKIMEACGSTQVEFIYTGETQHHMINVLSGSTNYFFTDEGEKHADFIFNQVMQEKEAIFSGDYANVLPELSFSSVMAIPMLHAGTIHGVIVCIRENKYAFSFDNFKLMQSLVQHFTLALTNSILNEKLKAVAITDYLTKLYTRNFLEENIQRHLTKDETGTLIIVDIDNFKAINDTFGHHVGDEVIVQIAAIIRAHTGENDIRAHWGGEELAIYLANVSLDDGVQIATKIRKQAENSTDPKVVLSCGVATWDSMKKVAVKDLFIRADKALYIAKETGKNCVVKELDDQ